METVVPRIPQLAAKTTPPVARDTVLPGMRLFVALELNDEVRAAAARMVEELKHRSARLAPRARITWVVVERLHQTLQFIGEVEASRVETIEGALAGPFDVEPFDVRLAGAGVFPRSGRSRVIWAGITSGDDDLRRLARQVASRLASARIQPDDRPFHPHITLGRVRELAGLGTTALLEGLDATPLGTVAVAEVVLVESQPTNRGHDYVVRRRTRLGGAAPRIGP